MNGGWVGLCGLALLAVWLLRDVLTEMCQEEARTRLGQLPYALIGLVALRIPRAARYDAVVEWRAELEFILGDTEGMPLTRLLRGIRYAISLLRIMLPFRVLIEIIAEYALRKRRTGLPDAGRRAKSIMAQATVWMSGYLRQVFAADGLCALAAGLLALRLRFDGNGILPGSYLALSLGLPVIWWCVVALSGGYDSRFIGVGTDEFRRVLNAGVTLTAAVAIVAYATKADIARGYVLMALPGLTLLDLIARFVLRKRLYRLRMMGSCMRRVLVVGEPRMVVDLVNALRRETYHGLSIVAACLTGPPGRQEIAGVPVAGGLRNVAEAVGFYNADTVAVLACPEMRGARLRKLAWALEKTGADLCVAPALLDVAGPRTTIRPVVGLPLLHVDHPDFTGANQVIKDTFDKVVGVSALLLLAPVLIAVAVAIRLSDGGPALFRQARMGRDGQPFTVYQFRTMVLNADDRRAPPTIIRDDPRITALGATLRRWSVDKLPLLINVVRGDMSLVGPRPALPDEAARYGDYIRRWLAVKPGITGLWQINGRSDLSLEELVRLDLRYVENWSLVLDLQILCKMCSAVLRNGEMLPGPPGATAEE